MLTLIIFVSILSLLVLIHELGHFVSARWFGVRVEEFGFGLPPRILGKKVGETIYSLNLFPFGGFVKLTGEDSVEVSETAFDDPKNFMSKSVGQRGVILISGVLMNVVLGVALYYLLFFANGFKTLGFPLFFDYKFRFGRQESIDTVIGTFSDDSAAKDVGVLAGEAIIEIDGVAVRSVPDVRVAVSDKVGQDVKLLLMDLKTPAKTLRTVTAAPRANEEGKGVLGVYLSKSVTIFYDGTVSRMLSGPMQVYNMIAYSGFAFSKLIGISVEERTISPVSSSVSGPVGIYSVIGGILDYSGDKAYVAIMDFVALMSVSLAFINILPLPALDGGRFVFIVVEGVRGKRLNPSFESVIHRWGMLILIVTVVLVTIRDIARIFQ